MQKITSVLPGLLRRALAPTAIFVFMMLFHTAYGWHHRIKTNKHPRLATYYYEPQNGLGGISGRIMGGLVPVSNAYIVLMRDDKMVDHTTTDGEGHFSFHYNDAGRYTVVASKEGYRTSIIMAIPVVPDYTTRNDFYLPKFNSKQMPHNEVSEPYYANWKSMGDY